MKQLPWQKSAFDVVAEKCILILWQIDKVYNPVGDVRRRPVVHCNKSVQKGQGQIQKKV